MDHAEFGAALAPVRAALLATAGQDADLVRARAASAATQAADEATAEAARIRAEARAQGRADATAAVNAERARAGRRARSIVLRAQREEYEALRAAARPAVAALSADPDYAPLRLRLVDVVRNLLGQDVTVREGDLGGVIGEAPGRRVDYSLAGFADRAADAVAAELATELAGPAPDGPAGGSTDGRQHR